MTINDIRTTLEDLCMAYPQFENMFRSDEQRKGTARVWHKYMSDLENTIVERVITEWIKHNPKYPAISDIRTKYYETDEWKRLKEERKREMRRE